RRARGRLPSLPVDGPGGGARHLLRAGAAGRRRAQGEGRRPALSGAPGAGLIPSRAFHSPWRPDRLAQNPPDRPRPQRPRRGGPFGIGRLALPRLFQGYLFLGVAGIVLAVFVFTNILVARL